MAGATKSSRPLISMAAHNVTKALERVRRILELTCEQDGQGSNLQESSRRKAYRVGINRALEEINAATPVKRGD